MFASIIPESLMFLGYNTNGFAHHRLADAIAVIAHLGYRGLALTLDANHLDPLADDAIDDIEALRGFLAELKLKCVIETGARFILDPLRKHRPTMLDPDASQRQTRWLFLSRCIAAAHALSADCVSLWSGTPLEGESPSVLMDRLVEECKSLADTAADRDVKLAFEPEPGMFIDTLDKFAELHAKVNHPAFGLTLDVGHLVCLGELPASKHIAAWQDHLWNVHLDDMRPGVHDHRMFGEGAVDFADVFAGLKQIGYRHGLYVELSRHSYDAVLTAARAAEFLEPYLA